MCLDFVLSILALFNATPGTLGFFGGVVLLISSGFHVGVVWSFVLSNKLLEVHPPSDRQFWLSTFLAQVKLIRLIPLWSGLPLAIGAGMCLLSYWGTVYLTPWINVIALAAIFSPLYMPFINQNVIIEHERVAKHLRNRNIN